MGSRTTKTPPNPTPEAEPGAAIEAAVPVPPHKPHLKAGLHPDASDALPVLGITASQITRTIGNAAASSGTHAEDGTADGEDYSTAADISVRGMSNADIEKFLGDRTKYGFAGSARRRRGSPPSSRPRCGALRVQSSSRDGTPPSERSLMR